MGGVWQSRIRGAIIRTVDCKLQSGVRRSLGFGRREVGIIGNEEGVGVGIKPIPNLANFWAKSCHS